MDTARDGSETPATSADSLMAQREALRHELHSLEQPCKEHMRRVWRTVWIGGVSLLICGLTGASAKSGAIGGIAVLVFAGSCIALQRVTAHGPQERARTINTALEEVQGKLYAIGALPQEERSEVVKVALKDLRPLCVFVVLFFLLSLLSLCIPLFPSDGQAIEGASRMDCNPRPSPGTTSPDRAGQAQWSAAAFCRHT